jgi:hypothetical protein
LYEALLEEAHQKGLTVIEKYPFLSPRIRGLCCDDTIALNAQIDTDAERTVVLCEELAHAAQYGGILQDKRLERRAREQSFDRLISPEGLVHAYLCGCREAWEMAEHFGVTEAFVREAISSYRARFGVYKKVIFGGEAYALTFEPQLSISKLEQGKEALA